MVGQGADGKGFQDPLICGAVLRLRESCAVQGARAGCDWQEIELLVRSMTWAQTACRLSPVTVQVKDRQSKRSKIITGDAIRHANAHLGFLYLASTAELSGQGNTSHLLEQSLQNK
jgi:hypothetical protein